MTASSTPSLTSVRDALLDVVLVAINAAAWPDGEPLVDLSAMHRRRLAEDVVKALSASGAVRLPQRPVDSDQALRVGWVADALAVAAEHEPLSGITTRAVELVDDDEGHHLDAIRLHAPSGTYLVSVQRETRS